MHDENLTTPICLDGHVVSWLPHDSQATRSNTLLSVEGKISAYDCTDLFIVLSCSSSFKASNFKSLPRCISANATPLMLYLRRIIDLLTNVIADQIAAPTTLYTSQLSFSAWTLGMSGRSKTCVPTIALLYRRLSPITLLRHLEHRVTRGKVSAFGLQIFSTPGQSPTHSARVLKVPGGTRDGTELRGTPILDPSMLAHLEGLDLQLEGHAKGSLDELIRCGRAIGAAAELATLRNPEEKACLRVVYSNK
ncbi:uncharacterized protein PHACADRAFT_27229 [Phanerochaete carnosa HHB-10118-sp]|uniref:Uncharacterized protein n=1 Tax=Phanerochaete carnosa (strain HHB-10118-sp) TaxID=650164 RepID=K5V1H7_PHACS|nr:uncharacterized protein PHACADRAFT_27229 [Phanerochaete carnosa HHB-10118-sp]EKM56331.1 hypothetical protein PHACADRAFT_27229 [Phanerochaete carnosa HHB-10118-sp]